MFEATRPPEREPIERLVYEGISPAYRHKVYWRDVNALRDKVVFEQKWASRALRDGTFGPTCLPSVRTSVLVTGNSDRAMTLQRRS
jgi:hypothetical protein